MYLIAVCIQRSNVFSFLSHFDEYLVLSETGEKDDSNIDRLLVQNKLKLNTKDEQINKL